MKSRREQKLQQLGITLWSIRRLEAFQGTVSIFLPANIRLVIVSNKLISLNKTLISDVLRTLQVSSDQVLQLTQDRVEILSTDSRCNSWQLGSKRTLALEGSQLVSPVLEELETNPEAKIALWKQICNHKHDFCLYDT